MKTPNQRLKERAKREAKGAIPGRRPNETTPYVGDATRQVGRVDDPTWLEIKLGWEKACTRGKISFTRWATAALLNQARKEK